MDFDSFHIFIEFVLQQTIEIQLHPTAFESRRLNQAKRNYLAQDPKLFGMVYATKVWHHYLLGKK